MGPKSRNNIFKQIHDLSGIEVLNMLKKQYKINEVEIYDNYIRIKDLEKALNLKGSRIILLMTKIDSKGCIVLDKIMTIGNKKHDIRIIHNIIDSRVSIFMKKS